MSRDRAVWDDITEARRLLKVAGFPVTRVSIKLGDEYYRADLSDYGTVVIRHKNWRHTASMESAEDGYIYVRRGQDVGHLQLGTTDLVSKVKAALGRHEMVKRLGIPPYGRVKYAE